MIKAIVSDFSRTLLFPKDLSFTGSLNQLHRDLKDKPGFSFFDHFAWNQRLEDFYAKLHLENKINIYIFTTDKIQEDPAVYPFTQVNFTDVLAVKDVAGLTKDDPEAYKLLSKKIGIPLEEILFIDDLDINLKAAQLAGMHILQYKSVEQVIIDFNKKYL